MSSEEAWRRKVHRAAQMARVVERLERLDDRALAELDRMLTTAAPVKEAPHSQVGSRRDFLKAALAGGGLTAVIGGLALWQLGYGQTAAAQAEAQRLRELIALYERLEQTGLDDRLLNALGPFDEQMGSLRAYRQTLDSGLSASQDAVREVQADFPPLQAALQWLRQSLTTLSQRLLALENSVNRLLGTSGPLTETFGSFLSWLLDHLPASAAENVRDSLERLADTLTLLPDLQEGLYSRILEPLQSWFNAQDAASLTGRLITPLQTGLLDPTARLSGQLATLDAAWQEEWQGEIRQILQRRAELRAEIARRRQSIGL